MRDPQPLTDAGWNYIVLGAALVIGVALWIVAFREVDRHQDTAPVWQVVRDSRDPALLGNTLSLLGIVIALGGILLADRFGVLRADGAASVAIGGVMAIAAWSFASQARGFATGTGESDELLADIIGMAGQAGFVDGVNEARAMYLGPADVLVNLSVDARDHLSAGAVEAGIAELEAGIIDRHPQVTRVFIEIQKARESGAVPLAEGDPAAG